MVSITKGKCPELSFLQDPSYGVPSDVTFQIIKNGEEHKDEMLGEVTGHKVVLAAYSTVFRDQFFGPLRETKDVIPVEQTTLEAFKKLVDYIYSKDIVWDGVTVKEMYEVVDLAEKYRMPRLMEEMKTQIVKVPITVDSLMEVAHIATEFTAMFPDVSSALLLTCAKFLQKTLKTQDQQLQFAVSQSGGGQEAAALKLLVLVRDLPPLVCANCGKETCLDGQPLVGSAEFVGGRKMRVSRNCSDYWGVDGGHFAGKVYTVDSLKNNKEVWVIEECGKRTNYYFVWTATNIPTFCYNCC
eukprot:GFUD01048561.1.p1 GENE.GFUD01048561.1~~GFUD01048561.1.p1  ORF type:complete len:298 (-),score=78.68 GFUD01048561.1:240-1133(-)